MTKREKLIMEIAIEIDGLLTDGVEIHPNSPIHEELNQALRQPAVGGKPKGKSSKEVVDPDMNKVYEFWYNECTYESAEQCMSLHRTREGAEKAMEFHKKETEDEWKRMGLQIPDYMIWGIEERIIDE